MPGLIGSVFTDVNFLLAYLLLMGLALPLGILAAAAAYQLTAGRTCPIVLFIAFCALSLTVWVGRMAAVLAEPLRVGPVG